MNQLKNIYQKSDVLVDFLEKGLLQEDWQLKKLLPSVGKIKRPAWVKNQIKMEKEFAKIILPCGEECLIDKDDVDIVSLLHWKKYKNPLNKTAYAHCIIPIINEGSKVIYLHRLILNLKKGVHADHIDGNGLDNRKINLRSCSHAQNMRNSRRGKSNSGIKGVNFHNTTGKWRARIMLNRKEYSLGYFKTKEEAVNAYNQESIKLHGEYSCPTKL